MHHCKAECQRYREMYSPLISSVPDKYVLIRHNNALNLGSHGFRVPETIYPCLNVPVRDTFFLHLGLFHLDPILEKSVIPLHFFFVIIY
jgi:hypothetical protein